MYFYEILQEIMDEKGLSISTTAKMCNLGDSTVRSIIARKNKTVALEVAFKLSNGLGVPLERLNGETSKDDSSTATFILFDECEKNLIEKYRCLDSADKAAIDTLVGSSYLKGTLQKQILVATESAKKTDKGTLVHKQGAYRTSRKYPANVVVLEDYSDAPEDTTTIPVYDAGASAGTGIFLDSDCYDVIAIPDNYTNRKANFAVWVDGHSMEPRFNDGDLVLVRQQPQVDVGEIGIFIVNGEGFIKKLGEGELISLNPDYENIPLNEWDDISCKGRVLGKL